MTHAAKNLSPVCADSWRMWDFFWAAQAAPLAKRARPIVFRVLVSFFSQFIFSFAKFCAELSRLRSFHPPRSADFAPAGRAPRAADRVFAGRILFPL